MSEISVFGRAMLSFKAVGEDPSLSFPSFWWSLTILGIPCFVVVSLKSLPLSSRGILSMSLCV